MNRRQFLSGVGASGLLLAGCLSPDYTKTLVYSADEPVIAGPTITNETAYFTIRVRSSRLNEVNAGTLLGVDLSSGTLTDEIPYIVEYPTWDHELPLQSTRPVVDDQQVFIGGRAPVAYTLTGEKLWTIDLPDRFKAQSSLRPPRVTDDTVYFGLSTGGVCALHRQTGEVLWKTSLVESQRVAGLDVLENSVIAIHSKGVIAMLNPESGDIERQRTLGSTGGDDPFTNGSAPHIVDGEIYVVGDGIVFRFDSELRTVWERALPTEWAITPIVTRNSCYVVGGNPDESRGYLYKIDRESGRIEQEKSRSADLSGWQALKFDNQIYTGGRGGDRESVVVMTLDGDVVYEIPFESQIAGIRGLEGSVGVLTTDGDLFTVK
ncbi:outer membrane protein assembly factor BamB family protein [Salarchaeum japonicum]|uniref:Pyrrolo-quinoline quinone repeat domain-containing protein n=1 Tax=Salarchaeum japonicum TaxID=555573 RepID=A0AAV3T0W5_9EURY|nr:PQQ-binding-like beta-propeller repeat protein [Salarchaeum japonicum]